MGVPKGHKQSTETIEKRKKSIKKAYDEGRHKGGFKKGYIPYNKGNRGNYIKLGYKMIYMPEHPHALQNGYVSEHRLIMEKYIGRYLNRQEEVHHKNENKLDNRIENLEILSPSEHRKRTVIKYYNLIERQKVREAIDNDAAVSPLTKIRLKKELGL